MSNKKTIVVLMMLCSLILTVGCGSGNQGDKKSETSTGSSDSVQISVINELDNETDNDLSTENSVPYTIEEQLLVDEAGVKITATEYVTDSIWGDGIKLFIENNTQQNIMVGCTALIVNDYMISDLFSAQIAAGKQDYETLYLSSSQLKQAGIDNVGKIEIYFHAYDDGTWEDLFTDKYVCLETSDVANVDTLSSIDGEEIYNQNGIRLVAQYVDENDFWGTAILVHAENNTSDNIHISIDNVSVNGLMVDAIYSSTVYSGKKSFDDITIFSSSMEENGITDINDIEFTFTIYNEDTFDTIVESEPIKLTLN